MGKRRIRPELWWAVYDRDHRRCIAPQLDPTVGPCADQWGNPVSIKANGTRPYDLTFAHIRRPPRFLRVDDAKHAVICCWQHHVMGRGHDAMWITSDRGLALAREYLEKLYGPAE